MTLLEATASGRTETVAAMLAAGADVNATDPCGKTPLMVSAYRGHTEIALRLIAAGADVHRHDALGNSALIYATYYSQLAPSCRWTAIAEALAAAGADPLAAGGYQGMNALMWARELRHDRLVRLFQARCAEHD
jgi:hypothetical protein